MSERVDSYLSLLKRRSDDRPDSSRTRLDVDLAALALTMDPNEIRHAWDGSMPNQIAQGEIDVVLVEDDRSMVALVTTVLKNDNINLMAADTCRTALSALRESRPRLLLVDLGLPDGDGLDIVRSVREWRDVRRMPIVALTSSAEKAGAAWKAGMDGFITKPFEVAVFRKMVGSWLGTA